MAYLSHEEFMKMQTEHASHSQHYTNVSFFSLKNDGDEAVVRFAYTSPEELDVFTTHAGTKETHYRRISCLRKSFADPVVTCPLCEAGNKLQQRVYLKLIEYVRNEDGTITPTPRVWDRPASYIQTIANLFSEYGDISNSVFKIKRSGARGSMQTSYTIMYASPTIYNEEVYKKDFSGFENYKILGGPLLEKSYDEMVQMVNNDMQVQDSETATVYTGPQASNSVPESFNNGPGVQRVIY